METLLMILAVTGLVLLNAMFVAAEFSFVRIRSTRLELLAQSGQRRAKAAIFGLENLEDYLSVCQLGITLASLGLGWLGEPFVTALIEPILAKVNITNPTLTHSISFIAGFGFITFIHVTFGELAPKNMSIRSTEATVLFLAIPMRVFHILFLPAVKVLNAMAQAILVVLRVGHLSHSDAHSAEEIKLIIADSRDDGQLDEAEERLINNIINLNRRTARDIMIHRTKVVSLSADDSPAKAVALIMERGFTRIPVFEGDKDNLIGFIHAKDLLEYQTHENLRPLVRPTLYIYDHQPIDDILEMMKNKRTRLGLVWDEYGSWQGLLTMEDVLESIVGPIQDEFDHEEPTMVAQPDGSILVQTKVSLEELGLHLTLDLGVNSEERYRSLAALLSDKFGETPVPGDYWNGYGATFTVAACNGLAVTRVLVQANPPKEENEGKPRASDPRTLKSSD
ncbi:MAG: hemolysin family protein [Deltaproteobacteria bacterium]|jgi:CBS domain containing-hemolysin-like protein|nr:hemolysin family protein [Deltaproteobacteria bacterium]